MIPLSYSRISDFKCPRRFAHKHIWKDVTIVKTTAMEDGNIADKKLEDAIKYGTPLTSDLSRVAKKAAALRAMYLQPKVYFVMPQRQLAFDADMQPTMYFSRGSAKPPFLRMVLDVSLIHYPTRTGQVIDWKTGKPWFTDELQLRMFALSMFLVDPVDKLRVEFAYTKEFPTESAVYDRSIVDDTVTELRGYSAQVEQCVALEPTVGKDAAWPTVPSRTNCKWCPANPICKDAAV